MATPADVATYLDGVATEATDRPRALAAAILSEAIRRGPEAEPPAIQFVESRLREISAGQGDLAAEIVYETGSILVELRDRFPGVTLGLGAGDEWAVPPADDGGRTM